jgi:hypothetical protein
MTEDIKKTAPNPDTVREFRNRVRRLTRTRGTNDYVVEKDGVEKVVTVSRFRATFIEEYDGWSSLTRDREPKKAVPPTNEPTFDFTELSTRKPVRRGRENTHHKKSGVLYKKLLLPVLVPVSTAEVQLPTEEDFHQHLVLLSQANWRNKLSRKKKTTWDERRAKRRARKEA